MTITWDFFPERNGNARKIISRVSEKRSIGFNALYTFLLVRGYLVDDQTSLEYISKGFYLGAFVTYCDPILVCYILGVKVTDLVYLTVGRRRMFSRGGRIVGRTDAHLIVT